MRNVKNHLIGHWSFNNTINDLKGAENPHRMSGVSFLGEEKHGIKLNSLGSHIDFPFSDNLNYQEFTIEAWVKPQVGKWEDEHSKNDIGYILLVHELEEGAFLIGWSPIEKKFGFCMGANHGNIFTRDQFFEDSIYHVVFVKDRNHSKLYINGTKQAESFPEILRRKQNGNWTIGAAPKDHREHHQYGFYYSRTWQGEIYSLKMYNTPLDEDEILSLRREFSPPHIWRDNLNPQEADLEIRRLKHHINLLTASRFRFFKEVASDAAQIISNHKFMLPSAAALIMIAYQLGQPKEKLMMYTMAVFLIAYQILRGVDSVYDKLGIVHERVIANLDAVNGAVLSADITLGVLRDQIAGTGNEAQHLIVMLKDELKNNLIELKGSVKTVSAAIEKGIKENRFTPNTKVYVDVHDNALNIKNKASVF